MRYLCRHVNTVRFGVGLEAGRHVHRVTPDIIEKSVTADYAGGNRTRLYPDSHLKRWIVVFIEPVQRIQHSKRHQGHGCGMIRIGLRNTRDRHIGVANRLYFSDAQL